MKNVLCSWHKLLTISADCTAAPRLGIEINCKEFSVKIGTDVFLCVSYIKQNFIKKNWIHGIRSCIVNRLIATVLQYHSTPLHYNIQTPF